MPYAYAADGVALYYESHDTQSHDTGPGTPGQGTRGPGTDRHSGEEPRAACDDRPALLLVAGQSNSHRWWDAARGDFEGAFRVITMDHRGIGRSDKPDDDSYSTRGFAADAVAVLDAAGAGRAHVYGTSMGGRVAQWLAADHPERVDRLVLGCTSPGGPHAVERDPDVTRRLAQHDAAAVRKALLDLMYTPAWLATHPGPYRTIGERDTPPHVLRRHRVASHRHDAWDALPHIAAPTLVVHGSDDVFNPAANAPLIADRIPGARLHLIPGARHAYFEERRDVAGPLVLDFLTGGA
ncbi:alpha/beta fold hydrolase [Prauserella alba]|uniref:Alpha/beta hydrolase n=1 Tax=Prauserella alba TaxID=176898 RepID=A0ABN1VA11_9PSEU|nr:alpha/beta fold hydrolase [Prauserella alba]MCP2179694.1 Pimeloyl-ACP methyl ester carboxylesterase [Prauserella alba]